MPVPRKFLPVLQALRTACFGLASALNAQEGGPTPEHAVSPHLAASFSEVMPKFSPVPAVPSPAPTGDPTRATVIRLPEYIVREHALPKREEVTSDYIKTRDAVHHYFGEEDSLYRTLNVVTMAGLWAKIPVLGKYPFIAGQFHGPSSGGAQGLTTTEQRARDREHAEKLAEEWGNLTNLEPASLKDAKK